MTLKLAKIRLERFLSVNLPNCWLVTMTFHENIVEKKEAMKRWKPVADYLKRHEIDWCGVWQQQKRGAWHHHFLINKYISVVPFREFILARGWGQFVNIEAIGQQHGGKRFQDARRVVKYLTRYLTRDLCEHVPRRVRLTSGKCSNRVGTTKFSWRGGLARVWRQGCEAYCMGFKDGIWQQLRGVPQWSNSKGRSNVWRLGCQRAGVSYVEVMQRLLGVADARGT